MKRLTNQTIARRCRYRCRCRYRYWCFFMMQLQLLFRYRRLSNQRRATGPPSESQTQLRKEEWRHKRRRF